MDLQAEKDTLIEMFGVHFETVYHLPPLASRIFGILILDKQKPGFTFENMIEKTAASKSSVSSALNLLLKMGKINYVTIPGDRKKYYVPSPFSERLDSYKKMLDSEKKLIDRMLKYTEAAQFDDVKSELENIKAFQSHILKVEELLNKTIERFKQIEDNSKNNNN